MQVFYIGANCRQGTSEKTGRPYVIAELSYCVPDESATKQNDDGTVRWVYTGYGSKVRTIPIDPNRIDNFKSVSTCTEVSLQIEPQPDNPSRNWAVGIK